MSTQVTVKVDNTNCDTNKVFIGLVYQNQITSSYVVSAGQELTFHVHGDTRLVVREATKLDISDRVADKPAGTPV